MLGIVTKLLTLLNDVFKCNCQSFWKVTVSSMMELKNYIWKSTSTTPYDHLKHALPLNVKLPLTIIFTSLYSLLFLFIWIQLLLILMYRHKRLSYQTIFLYLCLLWAALRTTLFSFYFDDSAKANMLSLFCKWLLYSFPIVLQYLTLSLLTLYFSQVVLKSLTTYEPHMRYRKRRLLFLAFTLANVIFCTLNISNTILVKEEPCCQHDIVLARVVINQILFVITSFSLCYCIIKLSRASTGNLLLEGQGTTLCQASIFCIIIGFLFVSRAVYNIIAVSPVSLPNFGYGWINVSDQGEAVGGHGEFITEGAQNYGYISFGVVLFVWEFLPTFFVVVFFRVRPPQQGLESMLTSSKEKTSFFNNPNRYDSDDDVVPANQTNISYDIPGGRTFNPTINNSSLQRNNSYGSTDEQSFRPNQVHDATKLFPQTNSFLGPKT